MVPPHLQTSLEETRNSISDNERDDDMDRLGNVVKSMETDKTWEIVGYVVAEVQIRSAAPYTRGSGPPSKPVGLMPSHDKDGQIVDKTSLDGVVVYVVTWPDKPALHMAIRVQNIKDHVSARTLELYEDFIVVKERERERRKIQNRVTSQQPKKESRVAGAPKGPGRPKKRGRSDEDDDEDMKRLNAGSRKSQALEDAHGRPGSSSSSAVQRGLIEKSEESAFEEDDTAIAIAQQLRGSPQVQSPTPSINSRSASPRAVGSTKNTLKAKVSKNWAGTRSSSRQTRNDSTTTTDSESRPQRSSKSRAVAAMSSIEAANMYEKLEKKSRAGKKMHEIEALNFYNTPPVTNKAGKTSKTSTKAAPTQEEESDDAYALEDIVAHRFELKKGKKVKYYRIKWVGNWDDTWEPAENVGTAAIESYEEKQLRKKEIGRSATRSAEYEDENDEEHGLSQQITKGMKAAVHVERDAMENKASNGKENGRRKSVVYDDDDEDDEL